MVQILFENGCLPPRAKLPYMYLLINRSYDGTVSTHRLYVHQLFHTDEAINGEKIELTGSSSLHLLLDAFSAPSP